MFATHALYLFDKAIRQLHGNPPSDDSIAAGRADAKLAWELEHMDAILGFGEYRIPGWDDVPPRPWPIGPWAADERRQVSPVIATELIRAFGARADGDQDHRANQLSPFADRKLQLEAAMSLHAKLQESIKRLEQVIADLDR